MTVKYARRHYEDMAQIVRTVSDSTIATKKMTLTVLTDHLVSLFENDNPRFDVERFRKACQA